jgi:hypothetical protein
MKTPIAVTAAKAKYEAADSALQAFIKMYRDMFEEYEQLVIHRNEVLAEYKALVSDNADRFGNSFGDWKIVVPRKLDAEAAEPLLNVKVSVDSKAYDQAVAEGRIEESVQEAVQGEDSPRLTGPKPVTLYVR